MDCHSPLFFRKIVEIERFSLRAAILRECQNYLGGEGGGGGDFGESEKISQRSHEKIGDCEQSKCTWTVLSGCNVCLSVLYQTEIGLV